MSPQLALLPKCPHVDGTLKLMDTFIYLFGQLGSMTLMLLSVFSFSGIKQI